MYNISMYKKKSSNNISFSSNYSLQGSSVDSQFKTLKPSPQVPHTIHICVGPIRDCLAVWPRYDLPTTRSHGVLSLYRPYLRPISRSDTCARMNYQQTKGESIQAWLQFLENRSFVYVQYTQLLVRIYSPGVCANCHHRFENLFINSYMSRL